MCRFALFRAKAVVVAVVVGFCCFWLVLRFCWLANLCVFQSLLRPPGGVESEQKCHHARAVTTRKQHTPPPTKAAHDGNKLESPRTRAFHEQDIPRGERRTGAINTSEQITTSVWNPGIARPALYNGTLPLLLPQREFEFCSIKSHPKRFVEENAVTSVHSHRFRHGQELQRRLFVERLRSVVVRCLRVVDSAFAAFLPSGDGADCVTMQIHKMDTTDFGSPHNGKIGTKKDPSVSVGEEDSSREEPTSQPKKRT